jgi:predicted nucleotidyltransferase
MLTPMDHTIVDELKKVMAQDARVHAMWIGGSVAEGYDDELSDIDVWLDIDDGHDEAVFESIETFLKTKGELDVNFGEGVTPPFSHKVYHVAHMDPLHFIEVTLHSHSHQFGLFDRLRKIKVLFDKDDTTTFEPLDEASYNKMLKERRQFLVEKIKLGELSVRKELRRQQFPDAMHNYQFWLVEPIIELVRIKHAPFKISHGLKHASRDLPKDSVAEIESLYAISSLNDLAHKIDEVKALVKKYS